MHLHHRPSAAHVAALFLALLMLSCELEDEIRINPDGTGTYRMKVLVEKQLAWALPEIRASAMEEGFRIVGEGETETRHFLTMERDFKNISEVGDSNNRMSFSATKVGLLEQRFEFRASLPPADVTLMGLTRKLTIILPARIVKNSAGEAQGNKIVWDASNGGTLEVTAEGLALPPALRPFVVIAGLVVVVVASLIVWRMRKRTAVVTVRCAMCNGENSADARFCATCGAASGSPAPPGG